MGTRVVRGHTSVRAPTLTSVTSLSSTPQSPHTSLLAGKRLTGTFPLLVNARFVLSQTSSTCPIVSTHRISNTTTPTSCLLKRGYLHEETSGLPKEATPSRHL